MHAHLLLPHTWFYAPINGLHQDLGGGGGVVGERQITGNLTFSGF